MTMTHVGISGPPPLPAMEGGVELYVAMSRYRLPSLERAPSRRWSSASETVFVGHTILVSFSTDDAERHSMATLQSALAFADCSSVVLAGGGWQERLTERLSTMETDSVTATVLIGSKPVVVVETVQVVIDALQLSFGAHLSVVAVVCAATGRWSALQGVKGFIDASGAATAGEAARRVFLALAVLTAPNTLNGIDLIDLLPVLGSATAPTTLAEALWLPDEQLVFVSSEDARRVHGAERVVALPFVAGLNWHGLSRMHGAVRRSAPLATTVVMLAPQDALRHACAGDRVGWVPVLCLPAKERT